MKSAKKLLALALVAMFCIALVSCGKKDKTPEQTAGTNEATSTEAGMHVEVVAKGFQHQFWKAVNEGAEKAANELGVTMTFQGPDNESAIAQQTEFLNAAIEKKPAAICLAALSTDAQLDAIKKAQENNIPIIGFDSGVPGAPEGAVKATAATDNAAAGALAAEHTYELIKDRLASATDTARIGVVAQENNSQSIISRTKGFVDKMVELIGADKVSVEGHDAYAKANPNAKVIIDVAIPAEVKDTDGAAVAGALLDKPDLICIYGSNEFAANVIITANEGRNVLAADKVIGVGFDAGAKQLTAIRDGILQGSVTQDPVQIGYQAVTLAVKAAKGESVSDLDTGAKWYDKSNMEDPEIKPALYE